MTGNALGLLLAGFSALTTAAAHALIKSGDDKLAVQAWVRLTGLAIAAPLTLWTGLPPVTLWPWLVAAAATHAIYQCTLSWSYSVSDFTVAYPVARGVAPVLTAAMAAALLGERLGAASMAAIATVSLGIVVLAAGRRITRLGLAAALMTGALTTAYSIIDARGIRMSAALPSSAGIVLFLVWFFVLDAVTMPLVFLAARRRTAAAAFVASRRSGLAAGIMSPVSFVPALCAFALAPVGAVAAIRETSVLVGMLIGARLLRETVDGARLAGAALIMSGAIGIIAATPHA